MLSPRMLRRVALVLTYVSEERITRISVIRVTRIGEQGMKLCKI
jgi:hypothetical protein